MKKILLISAISALLSNTALALPNTGTVDISSAVSAATGTYAVSSGGNTSYQGGSVTAQNLSFGQIKTNDIDGHGTLPTDLASKYCDKGDLTAKYTTDTHTLSGTAFSGGKVVTNTFGSGTGSSDAAGQQQGTTKVNATSTPENDGITLTVSPEASVFGQAWSHSVDNGFDHDTSVAQAGETSTAAVTVYTKPQVYVPPSDWGHWVGRPGHEEWHSLPLPSSGQNPHGDGEWLHPGHYETSNLAPQVAVLTTATSEGALCVGSHCNVTDQVGAYVTGTGDGNFQWATTYSIGAGGNLYNDQDASASYQGITTTTIGQHEVH